MATAKVIEGDATAALPALLDDLSGRYIVVITDPPYGIRNRFGHNDSPNGKRTMSFEWDEPDVTGLVIDTLTVAARAARALFSWLGASQISPAENALLGAGMTPKPYTWVKAFPPPAAPGNFWTSGAEWALFAYRPGAWFGDARPIRPNVWHGDSLRAGNRERAGHPTQKPLGLMRHLVAGLCPPGAVVVDPFCGSGTTLVAAAERGLDAVGIEINPRWCEMARWRLGTVTPDLPHLDGGYESGDR